MLDRQHRQLELEWARIFWASSCFEYLALALCWVVRKEGYTQVGSWHSLGLTGVLSITHSFKPYCASLKARRLGQDLILGSIGLWAYLLRAFIQARAFELSRVPIPGLLVRGGRAAVEAPTLKNQLFYFYAREKKKWQDVNQVLGLNVGHLFLLFWDFFWGRFSPTRQERDWNVIEGIRSLGILFMLFHRRQTRRPLWSTFEWYVLGLIPVSTDSFSESLRLKKGMD